VNRIFCLIDLNLNKISKKRLDKDDIIIHIDNENYFQ